MFEERGGYYVSTDVLERLKAEVEDRAQTCSMEVRLIGGLLKFTPAGVYTRVLLELEQPASANYAVIYRHRTAKLTSKNKGKAVSARWVLGFLEHNSSEAKEAIAQKQAEDAQKQEAMKVEAERRLTRANCSPVPRVRCTSCYGQGRWQMGDPRDGDSRFEYCLVCRGAGYVDA